MGSCRTVKCPISPTAIGGTTTDPPSSVAFAKVSATLSTWMYEFQKDGAPLAFISSLISPSPAAATSPRMNIQYGPAPPSTSSVVHPNTFS